MAGSASREKTGLGAFWLDPFLATFFPSPRFIVHPYEICRTLWSGIIGGRNFGVGDTANHGWRSTPRFSSKAIEPGYFFRPAITVNGFQNKGDMVKAVILHDPRKDLPAQVSLAKGVVAVELLPQGGLAVIEVHPFQEIKAQHLVKMSEDLLIIVPDVVPGSIEMAGVKADPHPLPDADPLNDIGKLLKGGADVRALASG